MKRPGLVALALAAGSLLSGCVVLTAAPTKAPATHRPKQPPVTVSGTGSTESRGFTLDGGDYLSSWSAAPTDGAGCQLYLHLRYETEPRSMDLGSGEPGRGGASGVTRVFDVERGLYFVKALTDCRWTVTLTPR